MFNRKFDNKLIQANNGIFYNILAIVASAKTEVEKYVYTLPSGFPPEKWFPDSTDQVSKIASEN